MEVYVYGTGCGAGELCDTVLPPRRVAAFVETCPGAETFLGRPVISAEELAGRAYDLILVASRQAGEIARHCAALGIDGERVVELEIYLRFVGKMELPAQEMTPEKIEEHKRKMFCRERNRIYQQRRRAKFMPETRRIKAEAATKEEEKRMKEAKENAEIAYQESLKEAE